MKKRFFNIQMFAEEATSNSSAASDTAATAAAAQETTTEQKKEPETATEAAKDEKKYSDADLDRIFNKKFAEMKQKEEKKVAEAAKLAEMNAQQKAEYERDQLKKELDALKRKDALAEMSKVARKMCAEEGITISDELLNRLVTTDAEETKTATDSFVSLFKESVEAAVKERLRGKTPTVGTSSGTPKMTKEQIMAIKDPVIRQQKMLENKELFNI